MRAYDTMLETIVNAVLEDYAGIDERRELCGPKQYIAAYGRALMRGEVDDRFFFRLMNQFLAGLQDRNLRLYLQPTGTFTPSTAGFRVRRHGDSLYVTEVHEESRLQPGDALLTLNSSGLDEHLEYTGRNIVYSDIPERQLWDNLVKMSRHAIVLHPDGSQEDLELRAYPATERDYALSCQPLAPGVAYLKLEHFTDPEAVARLIAENEELLSSADRLIVDVCKNIGGIDEAFFPLLRFIHHEPVRLAELLGDEGVYTNYSANNCERRIRQLEALAAEGASGDDAGWIAEEIASLRAKSGKGYLFERDEDLPSLDFLVEGGRPEQRVIVLADTFCENAAETFVEVAKRSKKVTVVGRPTMGNIDYCNHITIALDDAFAFSYPISKTKRAWEGRGISGRGVAVDVYVPWTPEECVRDVLLERAVELS
ncbi:MAG: S41 family peptidase [Coriobacteriia bacterium]